MSAAQAFIAYLKCEASLAEQRATQLRATAAAIEANTPTEAEQRKKRRKLAASTSPAPVAHPKRAATGWTLFVQENYESIKNANARDGGAVLNSKEVLQQIARQWQQVGDQEQEAWQSRAEQLRQADLANINPNAGTNRTTGQGPPAAMGDDDDDEEGEEATESMRSLSDPPVEDAAKKRPARKKPPPV